MRAFAHPDDADDLKDILEKNVDARDVWVEEVDLLASNPDLHVVELGS